MTTATKMTKRTQNAIAKYGEQLCRDAFQLNHTDGEGASTVATYLGLKTTAQANQAIDAGRALTESYQTRYNVADLDFVRAGSDFLGDRWSAHIGGVAMVEGTVYTFVRRDGTTYNALCKRNPLATRPAAIVGYDRYAAASFVVECD